MAALPAYLRGGVLVPLFVAFDQASKFWVEYTLPFQAKVEVIPFLALFRTYNEGIAFSMLSELNDWVLVAFTLIIIGFVWWLWRQSDPSRRLAHLGFALIMGGAIGNLIDRTLLGHVVDFILFHTETWSFAVFNLADTFINLGAGAIIISEIMQFWRSDKVSDEGQDTGNENS